MTMDQVIEYGLAWAQATHYYEHLIRPTPETSDISAALVTMTHRRYKNALLDYWGEQIEMGEATRRMEAEISELLRTQHS